MKTVASTLILSAALGSAAAASIAGYDTSSVGPSNANCQRKTYSLDISSENTVFKSVQSNANQTYITALQLAFVTSLPGAPNFTETYTVPEKKTVNGTYKLSGTLCTPKQGEKDKGIVQLLVHGIGFDSSYWNFNPGDPTYSYVYQAAKAGYSTFRYDRLGTGLSDHPKDTYNVVQAPTDLAILTKFASYLRSGKVGGRSFNKIFGVGHSYGSVQLQSLTAQNASAVDGVVLTGFSTNTTAQPYYLSATGYSIASAVAPERFSKGSLSNGYLITVAPQTSQFNFLYFPYYTEKAANLARQTEQPVTQGVLFTFAKLVQTASEFRGPVHVVTGDKDFIFCTSNCYAVPPGSGLSSILDGVKDLYPNASNFTTAIPANVGHGITAHKGAPAAYADIQKVLAGLAA